MRVTLADQESGEIITIDRQDPAFASAFSKFASNSAPLPSYEGEVVMKAGRVQSVSVYHDDPWPLRNRWAERAGKDSSEDASEIEKLLGIHH